MADIKVTKETPGALTYPPETYFPTLPFGSLFGTNPFNLMKRFGDEFDRMFGTFVPPAEMELWAPALEIKHKEGNFIVVAELPGIAKEDIKVEVVEESLVIEGEKKKVKEEKERAIIGPNAPMASSIGPSHCLKEPKRTW